MIFITYNGGDWRSGGFGTLLTKHVRKNESVDGKIINN